MTFRNIIAGSAIVLATTLSGIALAGTSTGSIGTDVQSAVNQGSVWVTVINGQAILYGSVESIVDSNAAERAAASFMGIDRVDNQIYITH